MQWIALGLAALFALFIAQQAAFMSQPWSAFWLARPTAAPRIITIPVDGIPTGTTEPDQGALEPIHGMVTDAQRYQLARAAGFSAADAIIATAISIAEDGSGDPAATSPPNFNNSRDTCLWQVNSSWWSRFGGQAALADPMTCARAAFTIYGIQGWCAWSTYGTSAQCGLGHNNAYLAFMGRAQTASQAPANPVQA